MLNCLRAFRLVLVLASCFFYMSGLLWAQRTPSAPDMVEQLKVQPTPSGPRSRSLRNLSVESTSASPAGADAAAISRPSLSLLIQFDFDSARVKPESQQALANLAQALQSRDLAESKFAIEGHTDARGRADYNLKLSQQRADAVRAFLAHNGVAEPRLAAIGKGSSELANTADPLGAENRRVRIVNLE